MRAARLATALGLATTLAVAAHSANAVPPGQNGQIVFTSNRDDPSLDVRGNFEVYTARIDGTSLLRLTKTQGIDASPAWSPDKRKIVFRSNRDHFDPDPTKTSYELYSMNPDGSGQRRLTTNDADDLDPSWSADGKSIAFTTGRDGNNEVYVMNADGSAQANLTKSAASESTPAWAPDGRRIAFAREGDIWVVGVGGTGLKRLTSDPRLDSDPAWSSNGRRILFSAFQGNFDVWAMNADGTGQARLTNAPGNDFQATWAPDGTKILFSSDRDSRGVFHLYTMNPDGSGVIRVLSGTAADLEGDWQSLITQPLALASVRAVLAAHARACKLKIGKLSAVQAAGGYRVTAQLTKAGKKATAIFLALGGAPKPVNATARQIDRNCA